MWIKQKLLWLQIIIESEYTGACETKAHKILYYGKFYEWKIILKKAITSKANKENLSWPYTCRMLMSMLQVKFDFRLNFI